MHEEYYCVSQSPIILTQVHREKYSEAAEPHPPKAVRGAERGCQSDEFSKKMPFLAGPPGHVLPDQAVLTR